MSYFRYAMPPFRYGEATVVSHVFGEPMHEVMMEHLGFPESFTLYRLPDEVRQAYILVFGDPPLCEAGEFYGGDGGCREEATLWHPGTTRQYHSQSVTFLCSEEHALG